MSKDFVQTANDVLTGVGLLRRGAPDIRNESGNLCLRKTAWWG
jgi:hypothetical protein